MQSLKSKMFNFLIRNGHIFQGKLKKEVFDFDTSIIKFREFCENSAQKTGKVPNNIKVVNTLIANINAEMLIPEGAPSDKLIMYMHGGGYVSGSCNDHRIIISKFASNVKITFLQFDYRLAPENPFPAAIEDSISIYKWILANGYKPENVLLAGESAGGGLTLATLLAIKDEGIPMPSAAVAISPWTDLTCTNDSYFTKNKVSPAPINSWNVFSKYYIGTNSAKNPLISPYFGDLQNLPPIYINSGVDDELFDDGEKFYLKAKENGVDIKFKAGIGMIHCYPLLAPIFKEATEAMDEIVLFIRERLNIV